MGKQVKILLLLSTLLALAACRPEYHRRTSFVPDFSESHYWNEASQKQQDSNQRTLDDDNSVSDGELELDSANFFQGILQEVEMYRERLCEAKRSIEGIISVLCGEVMFTNRLRDIYTLIDEECNESDSSADDGQNDLRHKRSENTSNEESKNHPKSSSTEDKTNEGALNDVLTIVDKLLTTLNLQPPNAAHNDNRRKRSPNTSESSSEEHKKHNEHHHEEAHETGSDHHEEHDHGNRKKRDLENLLNDDTSESDSSDHKDHRPKRSPNTSESSSEEHKKHNEHHHEEAHETGSDHHEEHDHGNRKKRDLENLLNDDTSESDSSDHKDHRRKRSPNISESSSEGHDEDLGAASYF